MEIELVAMRDFHLDGVMEIENRSFPSPWSRAAFFHEITGNDFAYYITAMAGKTVAGYAGMWIILDEAHITTLAVHPSYRGKGIGGMLLRELASRAKQKGCAKMTLEVRPSNSHALELYEKLGFVSCGVRPKYYSDTGEDAMIMWRDI